jgi:pimeloyl-ACP methyl ester carboxylesterase
VPTHERIAARIQHRTVRVGDLDLHDTEAGSDRGAPVLLLHGWPTSAALWRHALPHIGAHRRVIALDLPGLGRSDKPLDRRYSWSFFDGVLSGFLDALGVDRVGLVVHDMGGPVGMHWAVANRERVMDLVLMNTLLFPEMSWAVRAFLFAVRLPELSWAMTSAWGLGQGMKLGVVDKARITADVAALYQAPFATDAALVRQHEDFMKCLARELVAPSPGGRAHVEAAIAPLVMLVAQELAAGQATGEVRTDLEAPQLALAFLGSLTMAYVQLWSTDGAWPTWEGLPDLVVGMFLDGAGAP